MLAEFIARTVAPLLLKIQDRHRQGVDEDELSYIQTMVEDRLLESWEQINTIVYGERTDDPS
jgi:hypothetical protein